MATPPEAISIAPEVTKLSKLSVYVVHPHLSQRIKPPREVEPPRYQAGREPEDREHLGKCFGSNASGEIRQQAERREYPSLRQECQR